MGYDEKPKREIIISLCALFFALLGIIMGIWEPEYHWPPPPVVGGGGESGGAGASGGWEPEGCPIINTPWDTILDAVKNDAGTLYNDELFENAEHALVGRFFIDIVHSYFTGHIVYHGDGTWDITDTENSATMYHSPYTGVEYEERFFTRDDTLPGALPLYFMDTGSVVRDGIHTAWLGWDAYKTAYFLSEEWDNSCFVWYEWSLQTCLCSLPLPWGSTGVSGGAEGQLLMQIIGIPMGVNAVPAIDIVARNARRSRRHRLLGGNKDII